MRLHRLGTELHSRTGECERLQKIVNQHQRTQDRMRQEVEYRMFSLRVSTMAVIPLDLGDRPPSGLGGRPVMCFMVHGMVLLRTLLPH